jgi:hypothetical protein
LVVLVVLQIVLIMKSMDDDGCRVDCVIAWDYFRKKKRKRGVSCKKWLLKRSVYSYKNLLLNWRFSERFPQLLEDGPRYIFTSSFIGKAKEDTLMTS